jgi:hypothetical protein
MIQPHVNPTICIDNWRIDLGLEWIEGDTILSDMGFKTGCVT